MGLVVVCTCVYVLVAPLPHLRLEEVSPALGSISKRPKVEDENLFIKFHVKAFFDFAEIYAGKPVWGTDVVLQPRDGMLLLVLMQSANASTGRIYSSVSAIARKVGKPLSNVQKSIQRLKAAKLIVNTRDAETNQLYILINPGLVSVGSENSGKRRMAYKHFYAVLNQENPRDTTTDSGIGEPHLDTATAVFG